MWLELGIARTNDRKLIRRAYANKLRQLDPEQDAADFQRLRAAFDMAMDWAKKHNDEPQIGDQPAVDEPLETLTTPDDNVTKTDNSWELATSKKAIPDSTKTWELANSKKELVKQNDAENSWTLAETKVDADFTNSSVTKPQSPKRDRKRRYLLGLAMVGSLFIPTGGVLIFLFLLIVIIRQRFGKKRQKNQYWAILAISGVLLLIPIFVGISANNQQTSHSNVNNDEQPAKETNSSSIYSVDESVNSRNAAQISSTAAELSSKMASFSSTSPSASTSSQ